MVELSVWLERFVREMQRLFGNRVEFIGLQGSYGREEANEDSDIDVVLILDRLGMEDLKGYEEALGKMEHRDKICGFISGKRELMNWEKSDLFQFYHDTVPLVGNLNELLPLIGTGEARRAVHIGACNMYHMCGHNMVHEKEVQILKELYKSAFFVIQAKHFADTGNYIKKKSEIMEALDKGEQEILRNGILLKQKEALEKGEFESLSELLFVWAGKLIVEYGSTPCQ